LVRMENVHHMVQAKEDTKKLHLRSAVSNAQLSEFLEGLEAQNKGVKRLMGLDTRAIEKMKNKPLDGKGLLALVRTLKLKTVSSLVLYSDQPIMSVEKLNLKSVIGKVVKLLESLIIEHDIAFDLSVEEEGLPPDIFLNETVFKSAFFQLLDLAITHNSKKKPFIDLSVRKDPSQMGDFLPLIFEFRMGTHLPFSDQETQVIIS
jgi:signal transduction histidine kinase